MRSPLLHPTSLKFNHSTKFRKFNAINDIRCSNEDFIGLFHEILNFSLGKGVDVVIYDVEELLWRRDAPCLQFRPNGNVVDKYLECARRYQLKSKANVNQSSRRRLQPRVQPSVPEIRACCRRRRPSCRRRFCFRSTTCTTAGPLARERPKCRTTRQSPG